MNLKDLLKDIVNVDSQWDFPIQGINIDSRKIMPGELFLACIGTKYDGRNYIDEAIKKGAIAVLCENENVSSVTEQIYQEKHIPIFAIKKLSECIGLIASRFYNEPSKHLNIIGITGTNGKTSCSHFIAKSLRTANISCGIIGTLGNGFSDSLRPQNNTTPDPITLQRELAGFIHHGAKAVAMEVTSHSLVQHRVSGTHFTTAIFTNLTRDHLDYHGDMDSYAKAKRQLFEMPDLRYAIINVDDEYGKKFIKQLPSHLSIYGYTVQDAKESIPMIRATKIQAHPDGIHFEVNTPWGKGEVHSHLLGRFNISNLLAVLTVLNIMQLPFNQTLALLSQLRTVAGRMQVFGGGKSPWVVVDYAHTPDALEQALKALREHCKGKLWCVFGCGGERDRGKRPLMAKIAESYSDQIVITQDNPRRENPMQIIQEMKTGLSAPAKAQIILNRREAIAAAVQSAGKDDIILVAGKGHEPYQIIGEEKLPFDDAEVVKQELEG